MNLCQETGKQRFHSGAEAARVRDGMRRHRRSAPEHAYRCESCFGWHLGRGNGLHLILATMFHAYIGGLLGFAMVREGVVAAAHERLSAQLRQLGALPSDVVDIAVER